MPTPATTTLTASTHRVRRTLATVITKLSRCEHHTNRTGPADLDLLNLTTRPTKLAGTARPRRSTAAKRAGHRTAASRR